MKIVAITSIDDWMVKSQKELKGFYPKKTIKISELTYPVQVQINEEEGTFEIYVPKKEEPKVEVKTKDKFGSFVKGFVVGVFILILICTIVFLIRDVI